MKLKVKLGKDEIGSLEVSTMPGVSHKFQLNKKWYVILKISKDTLEVSEVAREERIPTKPGKPGED